MRSYRDLRELSQEQLDTLASQSRRAADVVRICRQVGKSAKAELVRRPRSERPGHYCTEIGFVQRRPQRVRPSNHPLAAAGHSLAGPYGRRFVGGSASCGDRRIDWKREGRWRGGGVDQPHGCRCRPNDREQPAHDQRIITTASVKEEIRVAVREVVNAAREGIPLSRIAVLCGGGEPVIRSLHDQLDAAGIAYNGPSGRTLADSLAGRGLVAMLNLESRDFRRDEVFALLSVASATVPRGEAPIDQSTLAADLVMAWERVSRRAGVARGSEQWETRLNRYAEEQRKAAQQEQRDPDRVEGRVERRRREADHAESLARFMGQLIDDLSPEPGPASWNDWCMWIRGLLHTYLGDEDIRQRWPEPEQEAANQIEGILDRLSQLDEIERRPRPATFRHTLISELGARTGRVNRVGHGVLTEEIGASLGMELDRAILIGMAEGTFPYSPSDDPLLPDRERKTAGDDLALLSDRVDDQHRHLLTALASAESSTLVYARGDARQACEQHPSRWLLDSASALAGRVVDSTNLESLADDDTASWFEHVPSFAGRVLDAEFPATDQEFGLKALALAIRSDGVLPDDDPVLARGAELVAARASKQFTRFDGNLSDVEVADLAEDVVSPTSLETWADCPMRYFFQYVLRVQTFEQPEDLLQISALEKGSLIHEALDMFVSEQLDQGQVPPPGLPWSEQQRRRLLEIGAELCNQAEAQGLTGTPVFWHHDRRRIMTDLERFLWEDNDQRRRLDVTAAASELAFGMPDDELEAVAVPLPTGRTVRFRGRADRVDQGGGNTLLVTDYKTGKSDPYKDLDEDSRNWDPVLRGTRLQLPVYGLAARDHIDEPDAPVRTQYWFVTSDQQFKALGYRLNDRVVDRFRAVVDTIADGIEGGVFCDRPQPDRPEGPFSQYCDYCNADRLGTQDRRRAWDAMKDQVELADYGHLAESPHGFDPERD